MKNLKPTQWGLIFALLSMDIMTPFLKYIGLNAFNNREFIHLLRRLLVANRQKYEENPAEIPDLTSKVFGLINEIFSQVKLSYFKKWAFYVFMETHEDQPQWNAWELLFFKWFHNPKWREVILIDKNKLEDLLYSYHNTCSLKDLKEDIKKNKSKKLSPWDLEMYSLHNFNNEDDINDPFSTIVTTATVNYFQQFWETKFLPSFSRKEKKHLRLIGEKIINDLKIWLPEPLIDPDDLRRKI